MRRFSLFCSLVICTVGFSRVVQAQESVENEGVLGVYQQSDACENLNSIPKWTTGLQEVSSLITAGNFEQAKEVSHELQKICPRSPVLNYMQGRIYEGLSDDNSANMHFTEASRYTFEFAVASDITQKIWYAKYESDNREKLRAAEADMKELAEIKPEYEALKEAQNKKDNQADESLYNKKLMWTGVGLAAGGLILAGTGAAFAATAKEADAFEKTKDDHIKPTGKFTCGWGLVGAGTALAVTGAVLTGIFGYRYTHTADNVDYAVTIAPNGTSFRMTF